MSRVVVITGASRGIGLSFTKIFKAKGDTVYALCRKSNPELNALGVQVIEGVEVREEKTFTKVLAALKGSTIDILINNAGIYLKDNLDFEVIREQFEVNTLGPLKVTKALLPHLKKGSKVAMLTSLMGSITDNSSGAYYGYRISKAALNAASKSLSIDLAPQGISVILLHPGYVKTDMTQGRGEISPDHSAQGLVQVIEKMSAKETGHFYDYEGDELPW